MDRTQNMAMDINAKGFNVVNRSGGGIMDKWLVWLGAG